MKLYSICYYCSHGHLEDENSLIRCADATSPKLYGFRVTEIPLWVVLYAHLCKKAAAAFHLCFHCAAQAEGTVLFWEVTFSWQKGWPRVAVEPLPCMGQAPTQHGSPEFMLIRQTRHRAKTECCGTVLYHPLTKNEE